MFSCDCRLRTRSPCEADSPEVTQVNDVNSPSVKPACVNEKPVIAKEEAPQIGADNAASKPPTWVRPVLQTTQQIGADNTASKPPENRICPITGAIGYCPMARPPPGTKLPEIKPELKVMLFLVWEPEEGLDKASVGIYPHMNQHWSALDLPDTSTKQQIKVQFHKLSIQFHPDKNPDPAAAERFKAISEAYQALREVDGTLAFPWDKFPERQKEMTGEEALKTFGLLAADAARTDPIKAQMMQHVAKESTRCKVLVYEQEIVCDGVRTTETWADGLCEDTRNGSNHLVKVYRRIVSLDAESAVGHAMHEDAAGFDTDSTRATATDITE